MAAESSGDLPTPDPVSAQSDSPASVGPKASRPVSGGKGRASGKGVSRSFTTEAPLVATTPEPPEVAVPDEVFGAPIEAAADTESVPDVPMPDVPMPDLPEVDMPVPQFAVPDPVVPEPFAPPELGEPEASEVVPAAFVAGPPVREAELPIPVVASAVAPVPAAAAAEQPAKPGAPSTPTYRNKNLEIAMTTTNDFLTHGQANVEAVIKSGQIWTSGFQDIGRTIAESAQAQFDHTVGTWKALAGTKSLKEAFDIQSTRARAALEKAVADTSKVTDASLKLAEQAMAPITARITVATESFGKTA